MIRGAALRLCNAQALWAFLAFAGVLIVAYDILLGSLTLG